MAEPHSELAQARAHLETLRGQRDGVLPRDLAAVRARLQASLSDRGNVDVTAIRLAV